jgi:protein SMG6
MDVDDEATSQASPALSDANMPAELPLSFKLVLELAFSMLSFVLRNLTQKASPLARSTLNPYISVMLTFLTTVTKHAETLSVMERSIPWHDLAQSFATIPCDIFTDAQGLDIPTAGNERWAMLTSGCVPPLSEDWCLRGMEWIGRKVFERGYWKSGEERWMEVEILDVEEGGQLTDGIIEDEDDEEDGHSRGESLCAETSKRWNRLVRCAVSLSTVVDGFTCQVEGTCEWRVEGVLEAKVMRWLGEDRHEREEEEWR